MIEERFPSPVVSSHTPTIPTNTSSYCTSPPSKPGSEDEHCKMALRCYMTPADYLATEAFTEHWLTSITIDTTYIGAGRGGAVEAAVRLCFKGVTFL